MINRRASHPLITWIALSLMATGQGFLLIPQHLEGIIAEIPVQFIVLGGLAFHLAGISALSTIPFSSPGWKKFAVYAGLWAAAGWLGFLYARQERWLEAMLFSGLLLTLPLEAADRGPRNHFNFIYGLAFFLSLAAGVGILAWPGLEEAAAYAVLVPHRVGLGALFLVGAAAGGVGLFSQKGNGNRFLLKSPALAWMGLSLLFALKGDLTGIIPTFGFSMMIFAAFIIPPSALQLPKDDIIGYRFILLSSIIQTAFLVAAALLLGRIRAFGEFAPGGSSASGLGELTYWLFLGTEALLIYGLVSLAAIINRLSRRAAGERASAAEEAGEVSAWSRRIERLVRPFSAEPDTRKRAEMQAQQIRKMEEQLGTEKRRAAQLTLLSEFSQQLENQLDIPVVAQLAVNMLQRSLDCALATLFLHDQEKHELTALASSGPHAAILPPGYRQSLSVGVLGRAGRLRKTQVVSDARLEPDFIRLNEEKTLSTIAIPLVDHGHLKALLEISDDRVNAFGSSDVQIAEAVGAELLRAWERSEYHQRLTELIQAGISLTTQPDPQAAVQEVASITRQTLRARFVFVTLLDQEGNFTRTASAGHAPRLSKALRENSKGEPLMQAALNAAQPVRVRDIRKYQRGSRVDIDLPSLRSMIAIPIRMHRLSVGAMLAFGKQGGVFFTENDESLARLLSSQAAAAVESAWLSYELRSNLTSATQLYQLSFQVIQAQELDEAAGYILEAAQKVCDAKSSGIILLTPDKKVEAEAQLDERGERAQPSHPMDLVMRAMDSGQSIFMGSGKEAARVCFPLKTPKRTYGALWLALADRNNSRYATNLQTLANQAAVALERSILLAESRAQAREIEAAYRELEGAYDHTLAALMSALDARDRETEGHSLRVARVARLLGEHLGLPPLQLKALERGSLLHDIGKIGISDVILLKPGPLNEAEWRIMRLHPDIGARIIEGIPFLQDTLAVVRYHQERWNGSGYPVGLSGHDIPYLARVFAVADAFDALTSDRPYRTRIRPEAALEYLREQAGVLFDPQIVQALERVTAEKSFDLFGAV